jgi:hypothetical protein
MSKPKFEITNPEAIKLISSIKSGVFFLPIKTKLIQYKWFIVAGLIIVCLLIALAIGKAIASRTPGNVYTPPDLETSLSPSVTITKSKYEPLRQEIIYFNTDLPDPGIPPFDNAIDLEVPTL